MATAFEELRVLQDSVTIRSSFFSANPTLNGYKPFQPMLTDL